MTKLRILVILIYLMFYLDFYGILTRRVLQELIEILPQDTAYLV